MSKILIVDDEPSILEILEYNLKKEGYQVKAASDGSQAIEINKEFAPSIIIMDVMMPNMDGIEACKQIRESDTNNEPYIIFLTARSEEFTEVAAWEAGGNDYLIKPVKMRALISRIKSVFNSKIFPETNQNVIKVHGLEIDRSSYTISIHDQSHTLPKKEFEILYLLAKNPNKVYSREKILGAVWEEDTYVLARTVDVHIRKLREKIGSDYIKTIKGVGYKLVD